MRDWIYRFARRSGPKRVKSSLLRNNSAIDISFGTVGFARVLARPFVRVRCSQIFVCLQHSVFVQCLRRLFSVHGLFLAINTLMYVVI